MQRLSVHSFICFVYKEHSLEEETVCIHPFRDDIPDSQGAGSEGRLDPHRDEGRSRQMLSMEDDNSEHPEGLVLDYHDERDSWLRVTLLSCLRCFACVCHPVK